MTWQISQWQRSSLTYTPYASTTSTVIVRLGKVAIFRPKALEVLPPHYYTATLTTVWRRLSGRTIAYRVHQYVSPGDYRCYGTGGQCLIGAQGGRANVYLDTIAF